MNLLDWFLVVILALSTISAYVRGIIIELFSLGGLIAGILIASWNYSHAATLVERFISNVPAAKITAFLTLAIGIMILCALIGRALNRTAHAIGLGLADRFLGAAFGFARGCLIGVVIFMAVAAFKPSSPWVENSRLSPYFLAGAHAVSFVVPHDLQHLIRDGAEQIKHNTADWIKPDS